MAENNYPISMKPLTESVVAEGRRDFDDAEFEAEIYQMFVDVFERHLRPHERDLNVSGMAHLGSFGLVQRHVERDGLALVNRGDEAAMRYLYQAWKARNPKRGLHFIRTYLQLLWKGDAEAYQLWQDKGYPYPTMLYDSERPNSYLTSRIRILFNELANSNDVGKEIRETAPALRSSLALRFLLEIYARIALRADALANADIFDFEADDFSIMYLQSVVDCNASASANADIFDFEADDFSIMYLQSVVDCNASASANAEVLSLERGNSHPVGDCIFGLIDCVAGVRAGVSMMPIFYGDFE